MNLPFHLLAALGLSLALAFVSLHRTPRAAVAAGLAFWILGAAAAVRFDRGGFDILALGAYGIFLYGAVYSAGVALLLARAPARSGRRAAVAALACAIGLAAIALDAFVIEPRSLELSRVSVTSDKVTRPVRIAVLADLQTDRVGAHERDAIRRVLAEKPDLIVMPGDYVQGAGRVRHGELEGELRALLIEEHWAAPGGVFAVRGNCEDDDWAEMFDGLPVTRFDVTSTVVRDDLAITGLTLADSFTTDLELAPRPQFHIAVGHGPDFALGEVAADLLIAGHTHGGQVRLPFIGPLITLSSVPRGWAAGVTRLSGDRTLIVSRGVGMERGLAPRLRFLCRPEIVIVDVAPRETARGSSWLGRDLDDAEQVAVGSRAASVGQCCSRLALRSQLGDPCLDESLHESRWERLAQRESDRSLRGLVPLQRSGVSAPDRRGHRVQARVVFPGGVIDERSSIECEGGNPVAEALDGSGGRGSNGLAELLEFPAGIGWQ